jgi:hypothetical protein
VGDGRRSDRVYRLQRLRRRLSGREQRPGRRSARRAGEPRDALAAGGPLSRRIGERSDRRHAADALPALRAGAVRVRLSSTR